MFIYYQVHLSAIIHFFKMLLRLQSIIDHSEFSTGETRHIVLSCNKATIHIVYFYVVGHVGHI